MGFIVFHLNFTPPLGFINGILHAVGDGVALPDDVTVEMPRGSARSLDQ